MARALVTGGNGFVAQWLMRVMMERGYSVTAGLTEADRSAILTESEMTAVEWVALDVTSQTQLRAAVDGARPDVVVHLAAISHTPDAANNPGLAYEVNTVGTVRLLSEVQRIREAGVADPVVLVVGSAEQYGRHELNAMPLHEDVPQRPLTLYAASKTAQEVCAMQSFRADGLRVICTRSFNHSGAGHGWQFLIPGLVRRALALRTNPGTLTIGNGDIVRDFLHVTDVVDAYLSLLDRGVAGEAYNVCSGTGSTVRALATAVLQRVGVDAPIETTDSLARAVDVPVLVGSNRKLRHATGWTPRRTRDDIIDDLIHAATR